MTTWKPTWKKGGWAGGRVRVARDGSEVFILERMIHGERFTRTLDARTEKEANAELALFDTNPDAYAGREVRKAEATKAAAVVSDALIAQLLADMAADEMSEGHKKSVQSYLRKWRDVLDGRDLRKVNLVELREALRGWSTARKYRIIALKTFTAFLRREGLLKPADDASMELHVPTSKPGKPHSQRAYQIAHVEKIYREVKSQFVRDVLCVAAKTGLHQTEIDRLARGMGEVVDLEGHGEIAGTIRFKHKSGEDHVRSVDAQTLAAVRRLQVRQKAPNRHAAHESIGYAAQRAQVGLINPGQLRHCFATWAQERGARKVEPAAGSGVSIHEVAAALNHKSPTTTKRYYDGVQVPAMIVVPIKLKHPEDPTPIQRAVSADSPSAPPRRLSP